MASIDSFVADKYTMVKNEESWKWPTMVIEQKSGSSITLGGCAAACELRAKEGDVKYRNKYCGFFRYATRWCDMGNITETKSTRNGFSSKQTIYLHKGKHFCSAWL